MMIRQNHLQDTLSSAVMMAPDDPLLLTRCSKAALIRPGGSGCRPLSKHNRLSLTPGLHLSAAPGDGLKPSSSPSSSSSSPTAEERPAGRREAENSPPRRPLKLAPLELPLEVKEAQWQKIRSVQQEAKMSGRKLEAAGGEPRPRKVKACGTDGGTKSSARPPLTTIVNPCKIQQREGRAHLLPVNQLQRDDDERSVRKEANHKERNHKPAAKASHISPAGQSALSDQTTSQSAQSFQTTGQSAPAEVWDAGSRSRPRLRRAPRLEEDRSKSGSTAGGLSAEEGKPGLACPAPGQRSTERALREASRVLEKASLRNQPGTPAPPGPEEATAGRIRRRMAMYDLQEAVL